MEQSNQQNVNPDVPVTAGERKGAGEGDTGKDTDGVLATSTDKFLLPTQPQPHRHSATCPVHGDAAQPGSRPHSHSPSCPVHGDAAHRPSAAQAPVRFPSMLNHSSRRTSMGMFDNRPYAPISPIHEEDEVGSMELPEPSRRDDSLLIGDDGQVPPLWTPVWLKKWLLGLFAFIFLVLMAVLIILWAMDQRNDGFYVAEGTSHYTWAYTPPILIVFIVAAWRMVDYHTKLGMPFDSLQNGPIKPSRSLHLDYISDFQLVSLFKAIKYGHFPVIISITAFVLLKVVTVFSTGLLMLLPTNVTDTGVALQARSFTTDGFDMNAALNTSTMAALPVYSYYGSMSQGMPLDAGVTLDLAYSPLIVLANDSVNRSNAVVTADVDAFVPIMTCQQLGVDLDGPTTVDTPETAVMNITFTIRAGDACSGTSEVMVPADDPFTEIVPDRQVIGTMQEIYCGSSFASEVDSSGPVGLLYTITDMAYQQSLFDNATALAGGTFVIAENASRTLNNIANVFCRASYTVSRVRVSNNTEISTTGQNGVSVEFEPGAENRTLSSLSDWNITSLFTSAASQAQPLFGDTANDNTLSVSGAVFELMARARGSQNIDILFEVSEMVPAAEAVFKGVMAQYAHLNLASTDSQEVEGTVAHRADRLRVNDVSAWAMVAVFALVGAGSATLIFIAPREVVPRDPSSIATIATILTRSTELNRILRKQGAPTFENTKAALAGYEFGTAIATADSGRMSFKIVASEGYPDEDLTKPSMELKWWLPITASIPVWIVTLLIPVVLIAVLEVLQRSSDDNDGLYTVSDDKWTEIYSHYIPGLVMLIVATLINMLDFNAALFAPWVNLLKGNAYSRKTILNHYLGKSPPVAFLQAVTTRHIGGIFAILAATIACILTIVASGLYTVEYFTSDGPVISRAQVDQFNLALTDTFSTDNGAAAMTDMIMHQNFSYPQFTYEGLAFPTLELNNSGLSIDSLSVGSGVSSHVLPALRANLRCEILAPENYNLTIELAGSDTGYPTNMAFVTASAPLPDSCHLAGTDSNSSSVIYENGFELPDGNDTVFAGQQFDLLFGENASLYGNYGEARGQYIGDNPPVGCPSLAFTFGQFSVESADQGLVTTMICFQEIERVEANVTFNFNSTVIDIEHPPIVDEGSRTLQDNPLANDTVRSFDFRIENNLAEEMTLFNGETNTGDLDMFFQAIIHGNQPTDPASLVGLANQQALVEAINRFYRIYMAQMISTNMREPISSARLLRRQSDTTSTFSTTITTPRLVQHMESKLTLQILLGIMTAFAAAAMVTTKMRRVIPCNPCSVAGTMALLAGSDLCYSPDDGLCECCGKARRRSFGLDDAARPESIHIGPEESHDEDVREQIISDGAEWFDQSQFDLVFAGRTYSLGWWKERRHIGKRRRFGVDVGERADGTDDQDWELGERAPSGPAFSDFMGRGGDRDGRGHYENMGGRSRSGSDDIGYGASNSSIGGGGPGPSTLLNRSREPLGGEA